MARGRNPGWDIDQEKRRFRAGDTFRVGNMDFRVVPGRKGPGDLRLDWRYNNRAGTGSPWYPLDLEVIALSVDVIADNENYLYPPPASGGDYVRKYVMSALRDGWNAAQTRLILQRINKGRLRA